MIVDKAFQVHWGDESGVVVLTDGENTSSSAIGFVQSHAKQLGPLAFQYIFGNWRSPTLNGWEALLESHRLEMRHHEPVASGKNATDINLVTYAMRFYYQGYRKFCIVASDSDYTPMLEFLCEHGCLVMLIGKATTSQALRCACSIFLAIPVSASAKQQTPMQEEPASPDLYYDGIEQSSTPTIAAQNPIDFWIFAQLRAYEPSPGAWVYVPAFLKYLTDTYGFRPKDYGYKHLFALLNAFPTLFHLRPFQDEVNVHEVRRAQP